MRFSCTHCAAAVDIEQRSCPSCGSRLGFVPELGILCAFEERGEAGWHPLGAPAVGVRLPCGNYGEHPICNWTVRADASACFCECCRSNARTPQLRDPVVLRRWARITRAKRRLYRGLRALGLLDAHGRVHGQPEVLFDIVDGDTPSRARSAVHASAIGPITIDLSRIDAESDASLFSALRRSVGLRLCFDTHLGSRASLFGSACNDTDRAIAFFEARWDERESRDLREPAPSAVPASAWLGHDALDGLRPSTLNV